MTPGKLEIRWPISNFTVNTEGVIKKTRRECFYLGYLVLGEANCHKDRLYDEAEKNKSLLWYYDWFLWVLDKSEVFKQCDSSNNIGYALLLGFALQVLTINIPRYSVYDMTTLSQNC